LLWLAHPATVRTTTRAPCQLLSKAKTGWSSLPRQGAPTGVRRCCCCSRRCNGTCTSCNSQRFLSCHCLQRVNCGLNTSACEVMAKNAWNAGWLALEPYIFPPRPLNITHSEFRIPSPQALHSRQCITRKLPYLGRSLSSTMFTGAQLRARNPSARPRLRTGPIPPSR
jgi:hypothetical protein